MTLSITTGGVLCDTNDTLALGTGGVICQQAVRTGLGLTEFQANEIYTILVKFGIAAKEFRKHFVHDQTIGPHPLEWELKRPLGFLKFSSEFFRGPGPADTEEWIVKKSINDETQRTQDLIDIVNLQLALLQNEIGPR